MIRAGYGIYYQQEHPNANAHMVEGAQATARIDCQRDAVPARRMYF